jgi:hypothetical protein
MAITIHPELQSLIPPLTTEEYTQLEANILADGCHDPLIVWQEEQTLLDGHHRHDICERHGLPYTIQKISLPDLAAAKDWIYANQLGRRNLTPQQMSYYRGEMYNRQKQQGKRTDLTLDQNGIKLQTTAARLATQHKVSEPTIKRDGAYAQAVDTIAEVAGPEARQALLARETTLTQQEVKQLADVAKVSPATVQEVMMTVKAAKTPKVTKQIVQTAVEAAQNHVAQVGSGNLAEAGVPRAALDRLAPRRTVPTPKTTQTTASATIQEPMPAQPMNGKVVPTSMVEKVLTEALGHLGMLEEYYRATPRLADLHRAGYEALKDACRRLITLLDPEAPPAPPKTSPRQQPSTPRASGGRTTAVEAMARKLQRFTCPELAKKLGEDRRAVKLVLTRKVKQGMVKKEGTVYTWVGPTPSVVEAS